MAVSRALAYSERLGGLDGERNRSALRDLLELWYLKTRFAYRVPLEQVVEVIMGYPGSGHYWRGGREGSWTKGENPRP